MTINHIYLPENFSGEARLFPLPGVVVFPHSLNPLRVFESRYREMFEDAISDDRLIAMATLLPGHEADYYSRPPIANTVCIGQVGQHRRNDDGTYDFLLVALQRATIDHEVTPVRSYRRAITKLVSPSSSEDEGETRRLGQALLSKAAARIPELEKLLEPLQSGEITLAMLTDVIAHNTDLDFALKLKLLEEANPVIRAETLIAQLPDAQGDRRHPPSFSDN